MPPSKKPAKQLKLAVSSRIDPPLKKQLERLAKAKKWTLSQYIEDALIEHVERLSAS